MRDRTDIRRAFWPVLLMLALLAAGSLGLSHAALWQYDRLLTDRALHDLTLRLHQDTPFHWPMQSRSELTGEIYGLGDYQWQDDSLAVQPANADPHFSLALADRHIDADYDHLVIRLWAKADSHLQVFHRVADTDDFVFGSQWIDVHAGEQVLDINLPSLQWLAVPVTDAGQALPKPAARWGGDSGVITDLRLDPVDRADAPFRVLDVRLERSTPWPALDAAALQVTTELPDPLPATAIVVMDARHWDSQKSWLLAHRHEPLILADGSTPRTPELGLRLRRAVLAIAPQAVWFPGVPDDALLAKVHALSASEPVYPDARWVWDDWRQPAAIAALLFALLFGVCLANPAGYPRLAAVTQAALVPLLAACLWVNARQLASIPGMVSLLAVTGSAVAYWMQQPGTLVQRLGLALPEWAAVRETTWLTLPAVLVLVGLAAWSGRLATVTHDVLPRNFWLYPVWVVVQQLFLGAWFASVMGDALQRVASRRWLPVAGALAGLAFSCLHFPNYGAMMTVLFMGTGWACLYLRHRNLWPLIVSHVVLGTLFRLLMPVEFRVDGDVGLMYFAWLWY